MTLVSLRNSTLYIYDGASPANQIQVEIGEGNLTYNEIRNIEVVHSRGVLDTLRQGDDEAIDVSFSFLWHTVTGQSSETIEDALKKTGPAAGWISASSDPDAPYCVNLKVVKDPGCPSEEKEDLIIPLFAYSTLAHSVKDGTVDCKGKALATAVTATRTA